MIVRPISSPPRDDRSAAMTPMIDVVFQLLAFFILTFRIVTPEGDFGITMPAAAPSNDPLEVHEEELHVQLSADPAGNLTDIHVNNRSLGPDIKALHQYVARLAGVDGPSSLRSELEVKLDFDPQLYYAHAMAAVTAVSAYRDAEGNPAVLVERLRFGRPRLRASGPNSSGATSSRLIDG
jgi:biopolymer transport protein ExbD